MHSFPTTWLRCRRFRSRSRSSLRLSLILHRVSFVYRPEQRGEVGCRGRWWPSSPPRKAAPPPRSWRRWRARSVPGARGAASPCPARRPSSGSGCRGCRTRGRAGGCDLQGEQSNRVISKHRWTTSTENVEVVMRWHYFSKINTKERSFRALMWIRWCGSSNIDSEVSKTLH